MPSAAGRPFPAHFGVPHLGRVREKGGKFSFVAGL
jgi:hypothetical protein